MLIGENLTYTIKAKHILKNVSFILRPGEFVALLGANGAGKSSLIKLLNAENKPSSGDINFFGKDLRLYAGVVLSKLRATMAQQHEITVDYPVREIVMMGRYPHYTHNPEIADFQAVEKAIEICGLIGLEDRSVFSLSGGERQRVHLARVLAQLWYQPNALLLLDEPISAMDIKFQHQTLALARELARQGWMVVAVLHDINLAAQYADRLFLMKNGRKLMDGTPSEVLTSRNIFTIFGIDADVFTNSRSLHTYIVPKAVEPLFFQFKAEHIKKDSLDTLCLDGF